MSDPQLEGHTIAVGMLLACVIDELEAVLPGVGDRARARTQQKLEELLDEKLLPEWKAALDHHQVLMDSIVIAKRQAGVD